MGKGIIKTMGGSLIVNLSELDYCTYCGAELRYDEESKTYICPDCGQDYTEDDIEYIKSLKQER